MAARFKHGSIYFFKYNPKLKEKLPFWDTRPLMIPLRTSSTRTLGLNVHWVPQQFRRKLIEHLLKLSVKIRGEKKFARMTYTLLKNNRGLRPALNGVRLYINSRVSDVTVIQRDKVQDFFLPRKVQRGFFNRHKAKKVFKR